jgi:hypothetical protein
MRAFLVLAALCAAIPAAQAAVMYEYDFVTTAATGTYGGNLPFTDPRMVLTVNSAVRKSGGFDLNWRNCNPLYGCATQIGSRDGVSLTIGTNQWQPTFGTSIFDLDFRRNTLFGSMFVGGESVTMQWASASGTKIGTGSLNADNLNCAGGGGFGCSFSGWWKDPPVVVADIPEPSGLAVLGLGFATLAFLRRTRAQRQHR